MCQDLSVFCLGDSPDVSKQGSGSVRSFNFASGVGEFVRCYGVEKQVVVNCLVSTVNGGFALSVHCDPANLADLGHREDVCQRVGVAPDVAEVSDRSYFGGELRSAVREDAERGGALSDVGK